MYAETKQPWGIQQSDALRIGMRVPKPIDRTVRDSFEGYPKTLTAFFLASSHCNCQVNVQDAEVLLVASSVELRITKGVTRLGRRILQSDGHDRTFCRSKFHLPCVGLLL